MPLREHEFMNGEATGVPDSSTSAFPWIDPVGGLGDLLMLSGVLKQVVDARPETRFNLVRRARYTEMLSKHPAIARIGFPPRGSEVMSSEYWSHESLGGTQSRAYQVLARKFGLSTPIVENLYLAPDPDADMSIMSMLPWAAKNIVIAPVSDSPRKMLSTKTWIDLVELLRQRGCLVLQAGRLGEVHVAGAYSLLGITSPWQLHAILSKADGIVAVDNFVMHLAHLARTPGVVLWGPTDPAVYGYEDHVHLRASFGICTSPDACLGPAFPQNYATKCPMEAGHCMSTIGPESILEALTAA
jgi:ADP-heptose:LPS heptosyltransferase